MKRGLRRRRRDLLKVGTTFRHILELDGTMKRSLAAAAILITYSSGELAAQERICVPHPPGHLPSGEDVAISSLGIPPAHKKKSPIPGFPDEISPTIGNVCITSKYPIGKSFCEVGQDGPGGTFDGPYACGPGGISTCSASGLEFDSFDLYAGSYNQNGDGTWTMCVAIRNMQPDNWRYFSMHGVLNTIHTVGYKYQRWWLKRHRHVTKP